MRKSICVLLAALLLLPAVASCRAEAFDVVSLQYPVPNPENMWEILNEEYAFQLIPQGEIAAGSLEGETYTIRFVGQDQAIAEKVARSLYVFIQVQYQALMEELEITIENRSVTVNGTEGALFTYPGGGQVLYAAYLPEMEPIMLIQKDSGLFLEEAEKADSDFTLDFFTAAPTAEPTLAPTATPAPKAKALPPRFGKSGIVGFMGKTMVTYEYAGASSDVADYIGKLLDAGYTITKREAGQEEVTLTFRNEEEDIELEIYQLMLPSASNSKILITYYWICPDGEIVDGKVVTTK